MTNAVIFVPRSGMNVAAARCLDYCAAKRYRVVGLVPDDWQAAVQMVRNGLAAVVVVSSPADLAADREPRVEVVPRRMSHRRRTTPRPPRVPTGLN